MLKWQKVTRCLLHYHGHPSSSSPGAIDYHAVVFHVSLPSVMVSRMRQKWLKVTHFPIWIPASSINHRRMKTNSMKSVIQEAATENLHPWPPTFWFCLRIDCVEFRLFMELNYVKSFHALNGFREFDFDLGTSSANWRLLGLIRICREIITGFESCFIQ